MSTGTAQGNPASRLKRFKADLSTLDVRTIVQKHITFGDCFVLDQEEHFALKVAVSKKWELHPSEVLVVGSGKLGFSIAPAKRYNTFGDHSDVDVAVASAELFDRVWREVFDYDRAGGDWPQKDAFKRYFFRGWVRPDMLPPSTLFALGSEWWDFFTSLTSSGEYGRYKIQGAIYRSWWFLERYQEVAVSECQREEAGESE